MTQTNDPPLISSLELIPDAAEKADLDAPNTSGGKLVIGQAPNITITETTVVADAAERLALDVQEGDIAVQTNVSTSFIFTGGDNVANNWEALDFDAVGAIDGEDINPRDITPRNITASGNISLQDLTVAGTINGADTSAAGAGEALTSDGSGGFSFASVGGITTAASFSNLPNPQPPAFAYVTDESQYYHAVEYENRYNISNSSLSHTIADLGGGTPVDLTFNGDGSVIYQVFNNNTDVYEAPLGTKFDISTVGSSSNTTLSTSNPQDIVFTPSGDNVFLVNVSTIDRYELTTAYDLSTANKIASASTEGITRGLAFSDRGGRLYEYQGGGDPNKIHQFDLSSPFDITTKSNRVSINGNGGQTQGGTISPTGSPLLEAGNDFNVTYELTTPFDISTATQKDKIATTSGSSRGALYDNAGSKLFTTDAGPDEIYELDLNLSGPSWTRI